MRESHIAGVERLAIDYGERPIRLGQHAILRHGRQQLTPSFAHYHGRADREPTAHRDRPLEFRLAAGKPVQHRDTSVRVSSQCVQYLGGSAATM